MPDANVEYLLYQTLVGAFPFELEDLSDWTGTNAAIHGQGLPGGQGAHFLAGAGCWTTKMPWAGL